MITRTTTKTPAYVMLVLAGLIGGGGLLAFMLFLFAGPFNLIKFGLGEIPALLLNIVLALVIFWQESAYTLITAQGLARWFLRAVFFLAIGNVIWALSSGFFVLYRLQSNLDDLRGTKPQQAPLITHGPYRWIRHPLYLSALLLLWSYPDLTLDRLLLNLLFTGWVIAGTLLEERKLVASYGETYRSYQREVPMMIPWRIRPG
jgi:protein-S-isoprenylcysteine O-methyltransferase Ste14